MSAVEVKNLVKRFGNIYALRGISFRVEIGEIYGLIGPNGAGKTTTMRILATLLRPTSGTAKVFGRDVVEEAEEVRKLISYLPEDAEPYARLTGYENLLYFARIVAGSEEEAKSMAELGAEISGLGDALYRKAGTYSKGMKRRLLLARTLMIRPKLAILDEPTSGLDVFAAIDIRNLIESYAKKHNITIILSSHNMLEVEYLCTRIALICNGKILITGTPRDIMSKTSSRNLEEAFTKLVRSGS